MNFESTREQYEDVSMLIEHHQRMVEFYRRILLKLQEKCNHQYNGDICSECGKDKRNRKGLCMKCQITNEECDNSYGEKTQNEKGHVIKCSIFKEDV